MLSYLSWKGITINVMFRSTVVSYPKMKMNFFKLISIRKGSFAYIHVLLSGVIHSQDNTTASVDDLSTNLKLKNTKQKKPTYIIIS